MKLKKVLVSGIIFIATLIVCATSYASSHTGVYGIKLLRESNKRL